MALLQLGGFATKISGKIGGQIFGTGPNGSYIKNNSYSQNPNTPSQSAQKNRISQSSQQWRNTTDQQKIDWSAETPNYPYTNRVGDLVEYNGYQLFNFLNSNIIQINQPFNLSPPAFAPITAPSFVSGLFNNGIIELTWNNNVLDQSVIIYATASFSPTISFKQSMLRQVAVILANQPQTIANITSEYFSIFPPLVSGNKLFMYWKYVSNTSGNNDGLVYLLDLIIS